jgi:lactoylglutathione lyase
MKFCWTIINVRNMDDSLVFYRDFIGLTIQRRYSPTPGVDIVILGDGETKIELIHSENADEPSHIHELYLGFKVDSLKEITSELSRRSIQIYDEPIQPTPKIRLMSVLDPNGVKIQFIEIIS